MFISQRITSDLQCFWPVAERATRFYWNLITDFLLRVSQADCTEKEKCFRQTNVSVNALYSHADSSVGSTGSAEALDEHPLRV